MNYYELLEVEFTASIEELKTAYRKAAKKYHPDLHPNNKDAEAKFKQCALAFETLSDDSKRLRYDAKCPRPKSNKVEPHNPPQTNSNLDVNKIECSFFGGEGQTGKNILTHFKLSKGFLKVGGKVSVAFKKRQTCGRCIGEGTTKAICPSCGGYNRNAKNYQMDWCSRCNGDGAIDVKCTICNGEGVHQMMPETVSINVPPNSISGQQITVQGVGEQGSKKLPGYLRVVLIEE